MAAALLTAELANKVKNSININITRTIYWTDSQITLSRIKSDPSKFAIFVSNRISKIQDLTKSNQWIFVPSQLNPADILSRGCMPTELLKCDEWWNGPRFLNSNELLDDYQNFEFDLGNLEIRKTNSKVLTNTKNSDIMIFIQNYSSLSKLLRITALILRFIRNCKIKKENSTKRVLNKFVTITELRSALNSIVLAVQKLEFENEIVILQKGKSIPKHNRLLSLSPYLNSDGILLVGGRLRNAPISASSKNQILLPASNHFSLLIIRDLHEKLLHAGPQLLLYNSRLKFWILNGRNLCKRVVYQCVRCYKSNPKTLEPFMADLPASRVTPNKPFTCTGLDYCGPFNCTPPTRSKRTIKSYIAIFVCFVTKAVHLEVVPNLSTQSFIAALRRFTSRRGKPVHLYSDNASNFVGARQEIAELQSFLKSENCNLKINRYCQEEGIVWHFIPPRSPHFGGIWESGVKSIKYHFKRVVGLNKFTYDELSTLAAQIEGCMNSRSLTPLSQDPNDFTVLTPGHFLIGSPITSIPDPDLTHHNLNRLTHYQKIQSLFQSYWKRWRLEYLNELQQRRKWQTNSNTIKIGDLVLLKEDNLPPLRWITGRVIELHPGSDGIIRVVTVKTAHSTFKRSVTKLCILPIDVASSNSIFCNNNHKLDDR